jgi:hypothetical protein
MLATGTARELWPFSPYPMYAWVERDRTVTRLQLYGIYGGDAPREFALAALRYLRPFDDTRLITALLRLRRRPDDPGELRDALDYCLQRYDELRRLGRHDGPPLVALQLRLLEWDRVDPWARTRDTPDRSTVVHEVRSAGG